MINFDWDTVFMDEVRINFEEKRPIVKVLHLYVLVEKIIYRLGLPIINWYVIKYWNVWYLYDENYCEKQ